MNRILTICIGVITLVFCDGAMGAVLVTNLGTEATTPTQSGVSIDRWVGQPFSTDGQSYILESVTLRIWEGTAGSPVVELFTDNAGEPGMSVVSFTSPTVGTVDNYTFDASSPISLTANTTYWVVFRATSGNYNWIKSDIDQGGSTAGPGSIVMRTAVSLDTGSSWFDSPTNVPHLIRVDVVPEPSSAFLLLGAMGCLARRSRSNRRPALEVT